MSDEPSYRFRSYANHYELGDLTNEINTLIAQMAEDGPRYPGIDLEAYRKQLSELVIAMRERFLEEDDDYRRRAAPEGSPDKPHRDAPDRADAAEPQFDYSPWYSKDEAERDWIEWWTEHWYRRRGRPFWFTVPGHGGARMMKPPLVSIYRQCNRFFRGVLGREFFPIFKANDHAVSDATAMPDLNAAARFFLLAAQTVDQRYTREHCKRVHDDCYRDLGIDGRRISPHRP